MASLLAIHCIFVSRVLSRNVSLGWMVKGKCALGQGFEASEIYLYPSTSIHQCLLAGSLPYAINFDCNWETFWWVAGVFMGEAPTPVSAYKPAHNDWLRISYLVTSKFSPQ